MVLGTEWFKFFSSILSDYNNMSVQFNWKSNKVTWVGEPIVSDDTYGTNELKTRAATTSSAFFFCRLEFVEGSLEEQDNNDQSEQHGHMCEL